VVVILCDDVGSGDLGRFVVTKIKTPHLDAPALKRLIEHSHDR